ncbi:MAG: hypothetical protein Q8910_00085 [Bacteroidota bacterium]|nr:hypothetical protein [Bacteroidota bacterium]
MILGEVIDMYTDADACIDRVKELLDQAINELVVVVFKDCWGQDEYNQEYLDRLSDMLLEIRKIRKDLSA